MKNAFVAIFLCFLVMMVAPARAAENQTDQINDSTVVLKHYFNNPKWEGVKNIVRSAKALVIIPSFKSGSLILGYEKGTALLLVRKGENWSDPAFVSMTMVDVVFSSYNESIRKILLVFRLF